METPEIAFAHGLGETQRRLLESLKRRGQLTLGELVLAFDLATGTMREHLQALCARGLVERTGTRRTGPGRPEILYDLTEAADALFPSREGQLLAELIRYLAGVGETEVLERFFDDRVAARRETALARVEGKSGDDRIAEVARILSEEGFMADVTRSAPDAAPTLTLCHCPLKEAVAVSDLPCRAELTLVQELLGKPLVRWAHMPDGDLTCSYRLTG